MGCRRSCHRPQNECFYEEFTDSHTFVITVKTVHDRRDLGGLYKLGDRIQALPKTTHGRHETSQFIMHLRDACEEG